MTSTVQIKYRYIK